MLVRFLGAAALVALIVLCACGPAGPDKPAVYAAAQRFITAELDTPDAVAFPSVDSPRIRVCEVEPGCWIVTGTVESAGADGEWRCDMYHCRVRFADDGWQCETVVVRPTPIQPMD